MSSFYTKQKPLSNTCACVQGLKYIIIIIINDDNRLSALLR